MKSLWLVATVATLVVLAGCVRPNLAWQGPPTYAPPAAVSVPVSDLGVNDTVDQLSGQPFTKTLNVQETTRKAGVVQAYAIKDTVIRWVFQANLGPGGKVGWAAGTGASYVVFTQTVPGPGLGPGQGAPVTFGPMGPFPCGLYEEIMQIDPVGAVQETTKTDNVTKRFFFIPSTQDFGIKVTDLLTNNTMDHGAGRTNTTNFTIVPAAGSPGPIPMPIYAGFSYIAQEDSTADTVPVPPIIPASAGGPGGGPPSIDIQMYVNPTKHHHPNGTIVGKLTAISQDGCIIHQQSSTIYVTHTGILGEGGTH